MNFKILVSTILFAASSFISIPFSNSFSIANATEIVNKNEMNSVDFVKSLGVGINLANSMNGHAHQLTDTEYIQGIYKPLGYETFELFMEARILSPNRRGKINQNVIDTIYNKGFRTVRIPISYSNHMNKNGVITTAWKNRVQEVVDMFLSHEDMHVIITLMESPIIYNYGDNSYFLSDAYYTQTHDLIYNTWSQMGEVFKNYDNRLIFENMNEPQYDKDNRWAFWFTSKGVNKPDLYKEANENLMKHNQTFVDTVRACGGNNADRYLLINPVGNIFEYAYDTRATSISEFKFPIDSAKDKLLFNAHAYVPKKFTYYGQEERYDEAIFVDKASVDAAVNGIKTSFIDKGIGAIITEWGSVEDSRVPGRHASRVEYTSYYMSKATEAGIGMVTWSGTAMDAAVDEGECFGFLNVFMANGTYTFTKLQGVEMDTKQVWYHEDVLDAMINTYNQYRYIGMKDVSLNEKSYQYSAFDSSYVLKSSDKNVFTIDSNGIIHGIKPGKAMLFFEKNNKCGFINVNVNSVPTDGEEIYISLFENGKFLFDPSITNCEIIDNNLLIKKSSNAKISYSDIRNLYAYEQIKVVFSNNVNAILHLDLYSKNDCKSINYSIYSDSFFINVSDFDNCYSNSKSSLIDITYINGIGLSPSKDISIKEIKLIKHSKDTIINNFLNYNLYMNIDNLPDDKNLHYFDIANNRFSSFSKEERIEIKDNYSKAFERLTSWASSNNLKYDKNRVLFVDEVVVPPAPKEKGCSGSLLTTSIIISSISLTGIILIVLKKKKISK